MAHFDKQKEKGLRVKKDYDMHGASMSTNKSIGRHYEKSQKKRAMARRMGKGR